MADLPGNLNFVSYLRVSTQRQGRSGLGLEAQRQAVAEIVAARGANLAAEYVEVESGSRASRPQLKAALDSCRGRQATLVVAKADRLGRRASHVLGLLDNSGVPVVFAEMPNASDLEIGIRAVVAQEEGRLISERTKAALAAAKARGVKLGGPRTADQYQRAGEAATRQADDFAARVAPILADVQQAGAVTLRQIADALNARGVRTARGRQWRPTTVKRIVTRIDGEVTFV